MRGSHASKKQYVRRDILEPAKARNRLRSESAVNLVKLQCSSLTSMTPCDSGWRWGAGPQGTRGAQFLTPSGNSPRSGAPAWGWFAADGSPSPAARDAFGGADPGPLEAAVPGGEGFEISDLGAQDLERSTGRDAGGPRSHTIVTAGGEHGALDPHERILGREAALVDGEEPWIEAGRERVSRRRRERGVPRSSLGPVDGLRVRSSSRGRHEARGGERRVGARPPWPGMDGCSGPRGTGVWRAASDLPQPWQRVLGGFGLGPCRGVRLQGGIRRGLRGGAVGAIVHRTHRQRMREAS